MRTQNLTPPKNFKEFLGGGEGGEGGGRGRGAAEALGSSPLEIVL